MWDWVKKLEELQRFGQPYVIVTVTQCTGSTPRETGAKMLVPASGPFHGTIGGGHLEELALEDARKLLTDGSSKTIRYPLGAKTGQCCGGIVELLFEVMNQGPKLYLFGAGHVGQAVCQTLLGTPFQVHVVDEREEWVNSPQIPSQTMRFHGDWDDFVAQVPWTEDKTFVAIMTHRHDLDQEIVADVIRRPARYIGLIGSQSKWERFKQRLRDRGVSDSHLGRVRCPIGLDIGGKAPQEVAISVASELLKIHYGR